MLGLWPQLLNENWAVEKSSPPNPLESLFPFSEEIRIIFFARSKRKGLSIWDSPATEKDKMNPSWFLWTFWICLSNHHPRGE